MRAILSQQEDFEVVAEAADGHATLTAIQQHQPDVALLDISLPGINGLEIIPRIKISNPPTEIVVLSMHNVDEYILRAYQLGALSYLTKDAPPEQLIAAIRAAGRSQPYYPPGASFERVQQYLTSGSRTPSSRLSHLTSREREVLQQLAEGQTILAIAQRMGVSPKTVESHKAHLCAKLGLYDIASLTRFAIVSGLISAE